MTMLQYHHPNLKNIGVAAQIDRRAARRVGVPSSPAPIRNRSNWTSTGIDFGSLQNYLSRKHLRGASTPYLQRDG
jgi:hypothetical protein